MTSAKKSADYFTKILEDNLKAITKPQYVDQIPKALKEKNNRSVGGLITTRCDVSEERLKEIRETLGMRSQILEAIRFEDQLTRN